MVETVVDSEDPVSSLAVKPFSDLVDSDSFQLELCEPSELDTLRLYQSMRAYLNGFLNIVRSEDVAGSLSMSSLYWDRLLSALGTLARFITVRDASKADRAGTVLLRFHMCVCAAVGCHVLALGPRVLCGLR